MNADMASPKPLEVIDSTAQTLVILSTAPTVGLPG